MKRLDERVERLEQHRAAKRWPPWITIHDDETEEAALLRAEKVYGPMPSHHRVVALPQELTQVEWELRYGN